MRDSNNTFSNGFNFSPNHVADIKAEGRTRASVQQDMDRVSAQTRNLNQRVRGVEAQVAHNAELLDLLDYQVNEQMYVPPAEGSAHLTAAHISDIVDRQFDARVAEELANQPRQRMGFWGFLGTIMVAWTLSELIMFCVNKWSESNQELRLTPEQMHDIKNNLLDDDLFVRNLSVKLRPHLQQELRIKADHIDDIARQLKERQGWCKEVFDLSGVALKLRKMDGDVQAQMKRLGEVDAILRNAHEQYDAEADSTEEMAWALMLVRDLAGVDEVKG